LPERACACSAPCMRASILVLPFAASLIGCPGPATSMAKAQEVVQEFNSATRYGRSEIAIDHVATAAREDFAAHHRAWGSGLRIADIEVAGVRPKGEHDAEAIVRVSWYRPEEQDLRMTTLKQTWRDQGGWRLVSEERLEGDIGLLSEPIVYEAPSEPREPARFPTIRLGATAE
jgi:hypothetical protein